MLSWSCCVSREDDLPKCQKSASTLTCNKALGRRLTQDESLSLEWHIVEKSIAATELERLRELREAVKDLDGHPACCKRPLSKQAQTLLRFLRGREGNVVAAKKMFSDSLDWRNSIGLDLKIAEWLEELNDGATLRSQMVRRYGTDAMVGPDKYGIPIWLMRMSVSDPAGMLRELGKEALLIHTLANMEHMHAELRSAMFRNEEVVRGCVQIIDVGDYGQHGVPNWYQRMWEGFRVGKDAFKLFDLNYPETARKVFIIRMGTITHTIHQACQPMIPRRTKKKMRGFGSCASSWRKELEEECSKVCELPDFVISDSDEARRLATPKGGMVPLASAFEPTVQRSRMNGDLVKPKHSSVFCCRRKQESTAPSIRRSKTVAIMGNSGTIATSPRRTETVAFGYEQPELTARAKTF